MRYFLPLQPLFLHLVLGEYNYPHLHQLQQFQYLLHRIILIEVIKKWRRDLLHQ